VRHLAARVSARSRRRKLDLFLETMRPTAEMTVVDVGVSDGGYGEDAYGTANFFEAHYPWPEQIVAVSMQHLTVFQEAFPKVTAVRADGRALPFLDGQFDIGFSNAVIEHLDDLDSQHAFVAELCRVSRRVFLATPNRQFPIDTHTLVPFAHWLPDERRDSVYRALRRSEGLGLRLLTPKDVLGLFPPSARARLVRRGMTVVAVASTAA
jgi:SAM-dependent methyltransferase